MQLLSLRYAQVPVEYRLALLCFDLTFIDTKDSELDLEDVNLSY